VTNLLSAKTATVDWRQIEAKSEIHSRILWAIRGGGGYFGVATALEDQLHPDSLKRLQSTQKQLLNQAAFCRSAHRSGGRHSRARA